MSNINTVETINMKAFSAIPVVDTYANIMSVEQSKPGGIVLKKGIPCLATNSPNGDDILIIGDGTNNIANIKKYHLNSESNSSKSVFLIKFPNSIGQSSYKSFNGDEDTSRLIDIMGEFLGDGSDIKIVGTNQDIDHAFTITSVNFTKSEPSNQPASYGTVTVTVDPNSSSLTNEYLPWFVIEDLGKFTSVVLSFLNEIGEEVDDLSNQVSTNSTSITNISADVTKKLEKANIKAGSDKITVTSDTSTNDVTIDVVLPPATTQLLVKSTDGSISVNTDTANEADLSLGEIKLTLTDSAVPDGIKDVEKSLKEILEDIYSRLDGFISENDVITSSPILVSDSDLDYVSQ